MDKNSKEYRRWLHARKLSARVEFTQSVESFMEKHPVKTRKEREMHRPELVVTRFHVDRCYVSPIDGTWHLEDSDMERVQSAKHPQAPGDKVNFGCHMVSVEWRSGTGTVNYTVRPTAPVADRQEWHAVNAHINMAQYNARLISNSDLPKRSIEKLHLHGNVWALNARQVKWDGQWIAYECDGFYNA